MHVFRDGLLFLMILKYIKMTGGVLLFVLACISISRACPELCHCNTTTQSIDCSNMNLVEVPEFLNITLSKINLLDLSRNNLTILNSSDFQSILDLIIGTIDVSFNQIREIVGDFDDGQQVIGYRTLNLSNNMLTFFPQNIVPSKSITSEIVIDVSHNALLDLPANTLTRENGLELDCHLLANNNKLKYVHPDAFIGLAFVDLRNNKLENLPPELKLSEGIRLIKMAGNPWLCDCNFRWILDTRLRNLSVESPPSCSTPEFVRGRPLFELRRDEFACPPLSNETSNIFTEEGDHQCLVCPVTSDPPNPQITWTIIYLDGTETPFSIEVQTTFLKLINLKSHDILYQCTATNIAGSVTVDIQVNISRNDGMEESVGTTSNMAESPELATNSDVTVTPSATSFTGAVNITSLTDTAASIMQQTRTVGATLTKENRSVEDVRSTDVDVILVTDLYEDSTLYDLTILDQQTSPIFHVVNGSADVCVPFSSFVIFISCLSVVAMAILVTLICTAIFCCHVISGQKRRKMDFEKRTSSVNEYSFDGPGIHTDDAEEATDNFHFTREISTAL